jgi:hypothetical protein
METGHIKSIGTGKMPCAALAGWGAQNQPGHVMLRAIPEWGSREMPNYRGFQAAEAGNGSFKLQVERHSCIMTH